MIFLILNLAQFNVKIKTSILLFVSYFSVHTTKISSPFYSKKLNKLELTSNIAACIILYCGTLYSENADAYLQALLFIIILIANAIFFIFSIFSLLRIFIKTNIEKIKLYLPKLTIYYLSCLQWIKNFYRSKKLKKVAFNKKKIYNI